MKRTNFFSWASGNYSSGTMAGLAARLAPSAGELITGLFPKKKVPPRKVNWALGTLSDSAVYLDECADRAALACLIEAGAPSNVGALDAGLIWIEAYGAFAALGSATNHQLTIFCGPSSAALDGTTTPALAAGAAGFKIYQYNQATSGGILARGCVSSSANRVVLYSPGNAVSAASWSTPTGLPNGTALPFVLTQDADPNLEVVGNTTRGFMVFDGSSCYYSSGGTSFTAKTSPGFSPNVGAAFGGIWVIGQTGTTTAKVSTDLGATWQTIIMPPTSGGTIAAIRYFERIGKFVLTTTATTSGQNRHFSADGITWTASSLTNDTAIQNCVGVPAGAPEAMIAAAGHRMLVGFRNAAGGVGEFETTRRLMYSTDGESWRNWDQRFSGAPLAIASDNRGQVAVLYTAGVVRLFGAG